MTYDHAAAGGLPPPATSEAPLNITELRRGIQYHFMAPTVTKERRIGEPQEDCIALFRVVGDFCVIVLCSRPFCRSKKCPD